MRATPHMRNDAHRRSHDRHHTLRTTPFERWMEELGEKPILLYALLMLATMLLYAPVSHHDFLNFDDAQYVTQNPHVRGGLGLSNIIWAFTSFYASNWHPVTWLSHMADCRLFGLNSGAHHCVNLVLHISNILLLFTLLWLGTGAIWRSFVAAALFAVHPLNVETVAWVAERKSLLSALFSFLTIASYGWYVQHPTWKRYLAILAAFSLALMSKPMAVTLPLILLLLDYWPLNRSKEIPFQRRWVRLATEKLPLFLMSGASAYITIAAQRSTGAMLQLSELPLVLRLGNALASYAAYVGKMLWPAKLAVFYPIMLEGKVSLSSAEILTSALLLAGMTGLVLYFRSARYLAMGWFLFLVTLIPVIGIVRVGYQAMADRYAYIPFIGLFIMLVWGFADVASNRAAGQVVPAIAALSLVVAFALASSNYLQYWQNEVSLFTRARDVAAGPDSLIESSLAAGLRDAGQTDEALSHYQLSCALDSESPFCHYGIAQILFDKNQFARAIEECHIAARLANDQGISVPCFDKSGAVMLELGYLDAAQREFEAALAIDPHDQTALSLRQEALRLKNEGRTGLH
jgi:protein O-mannosyl-transferase